MENDKDMRKQLTPFEQAFKTTPLSSSLQIIGFYLVLGILWIFFSDMALKLLVQDPERVEELQLVKGLFYLAVTAYIFYVIVKRRMDTYYNIMNHLNETMLELKQTNQTMKELEHE